MGGELWEKGIPGFCGKNSRCLYPTFSGSWNVPEFLERSPNFSWPWSSPGFQDFFSHLSLIPEFSRILGVLLQLFLPLECSRIPGFLLNFSLPLECSRIPISWSLWPHSSQNLWIWGHLGAATSIWGDEEFPPSWIGNIPRNELPIFVAFYWFLLIFTDFHSIFQKFLAFPGAGKGPNSEEKWERNVKEKKKPPWWEMNNSAARRTLSANDL